MELDTGVPVPDELDLSAEAQDGPAGAHEIERLLTGCFFTIAGGGAVSAWNARAQATFGFTNAAVVGESFVEKLVAPSERETRTAEIDALLGNDGPPVAVHIETRAVNAQGHEFEERFAVVPIRLHDGYELNALLQDIGKQQDGDDRERLRKVHATVLDLIAAELTGRVEPATDGGEETHRLVGALVIYDGADAPATGSAGEEGESAEDDLEAARRQIDDLRTRLEELERETEEARHDAELAREEVEQTRTKLSDLRGSADEEHGRAAQLDSELAELRGALEAAEKALEESRARAEEIEAELAAARAELDEARSANESLQSELEGNLDDLGTRLEAKEAELAEVVARRDELAEELDKQQAELAEVAGRRDELAGELEARQSDLEAARASGDEQTEALRLELDEARSARDEAAAKLSEKEGELSDLAADRQELAEELETGRAELAEVAGRRDELAGEAEKHDAEREQLAEELARRDTELAEARAAADEAKGDGDRRQSRVDELAKALQDAQHGADRAKSEAEAARGKLEGVETELEETRLKAKGAIGELDDARHQVELFRGAFDTAPIGMALTAPDGRFVKVNETLCQELGYTEEQLLSDDPPSIVHPDDMAANREMARRLLAGEIKTSRAERRYVHADGHEIHMRESVALVRDGSDTPLLFIFQLEDATEQIELGAADEPRELGSASGSLPVPLGGDRATSDPAAVEGPFLSPERVRQALEDDQFVLYCQPVLDLRSSEISQYELLIRMVDDDGRLILPQAFLKPAEQAGLIRSIDHWVVRRAIRLISENSQAGRDVRIEVNVSPESLVDRELLGVIDQELAATPIHPSNLVVEVTESAAAANPEGASALAKGVRGLGARFALDDFGSTFGSFRHLKDLPLDYLKIDGDLVGSLTESRTSQLVVKALVDVARGTGTETIAVFVSDDETLMLLRQHGVGYAQGYVVGRPQPLSEVFADGRAALPPAG